MLFNSIDFALFLPIVFILFWVLKKRELVYQNGLLLVASYVFYGWWDYRFLILIFLSTLVDYSVGLQLDKQKNERARRRLLYISVFFNVSLLGFFKYFNFFVDNFVEAFSLFGYKLQAHTLDIILPVGISFYTFQTMSYTIDVYRRKMIPTHNFVAFAAFVSFFPQLVAGPIERATHLLPQFYVKKRFVYAQAIDGLRQMLWGLFKKIVIADNCARYVNMIFSDYSAHSGSELVLGAFFFSLQIYGDFSGYSDIAIGTSRLFGFDLKKNFAFPYFSRDIAEFWRRWHISLSTWFRDYVYIPLGGSRGTLLNKVRNVFVIFLISGFWHGANWTFIVWGALNALYFIPILLLNANRNHLDTVAEGKWLPSLREVLGMVVTFVLTMLAWIFFRAPSVYDALHYIKGIFSKSLWVIPKLESSEISAKIMFLLIAVFFLIEWLQRTKNHALEFQQNKFSRPIRWFGYYLIIIAIIYFGAEQQEFIYFQF